mgnify:CR=1 FL=1
MAFKGPFRLKQFYDSLILQSLKCSGQTVLLGVHRSSVFSALQSCSFQPNTARPHPVKSPPPQQHTKSYAARAWGSVGINVHRHLWCGTGDFPDRLIATQVPQRSDAQGMLGLQGTAVWTDV